MRAEIDELIDARNNIGRVESVKDDGEEQR